MNLSPLLPEHPRIIHRVPRALTAALHGPEGSGVFIFMKSTSASQLEIWVSRPRTVDTFQWASPTLCATCALEERAMTKAGRMKHEIIEFGSV